MALVNDLNRFLDQTFKLSDLRRILSSADPSFQKLPLPYEIFVVKEEAFGASWGVVLSYQDHGFVLMLYSDKVGGSTLWTVVIGDKGFVRKSGIPQWLESIPISALSVFEDFISWDMHESSFRKHYQAVYFLQ